TCVAATGGVDTRRASRSPSSCSSPASQPWSQTRVGCARQVRRPARTDDTSRSSAPRLGLKEGPDCQCDYLQRSRGLSTAETRDAAGNERGANRPSTEPRPLSKDRLGARSKAAAASTEPRLPGTSTQVRYTPVGFASGTEGGSFGSGICMFV